ncbi:MAG: hypothetical protein Q7S02_02325 [bacterium]|nr:hypothetical protein [bacterium]
MTQRLESRLVQTLRLELRLELRHVLQLIIELVQALRLEQHVTLASVMGLRNAIRGLAHDDQVALADHIIGRSSEQAAIDLATVLRAVAWSDREQGSDVLREFSELIDRYRKGVAQRVDHARGPTLALRLVLRDPQFFGGRPGTPDEVAALLRAVPQEDGDGTLAWVLGGGWAVELLCGERIREHHDIDTIILTRRPLYLDTDAVHTDDYFGVITCTNRFFVTRCMCWVDVDIGAAVPYRGRVAVACPEFLFCSKFLRAPRAQDWLDVQAIVRADAASWDIDLIAALAKRNCCDFTRARDLLEILRTRNPERILDALQSFWL